MPYAELHCHTNFSFLDGASPADSLVDRAVALGLVGLAVTDHHGLYGVVRFAEAAMAAGLRPIVGVEVELLDAAAADPRRVVVPEPRAWRPGRRRASPAIDPEVVEGRPVRPRPRRARLPAHRVAVKEDYRGIGEAQRGPHLVLLARNDAGYRSLCRLVSRANLAGTKAVPRFTQALVAEHAEGLVGLTGCREGEIARRLAVGDRAGAREVAEHYARLFGERGLYLELEHRLLPDDDWLVAETITLADELGLPVVVTNDVHYAEREGRELHDVLAAIRHGRSVDELADLRRPDGESYLKSEAELLELPPGDGSLGGRVAARWREGIDASAWIAADCSVDLGFERYRFPGFEVPAGETPFSHLSQLCWDGARRRYHPLTSAVVSQLAHELDVVEQTGLAEFFLICWDLMRFARSRGIPAQGRGSAADSIVAYVLGITRVDPIRHNLLFERFINEGRTSYPDVDIDFSSERREEVIQYVYERYGADHTGMVCNVVTYRARSAVREVGYALGFPRPLVDRVAKALETYDSVMVRRDLEAEGGFGQFFARPGDAGVPGDDVAETAARTAERGLTDGMGQLNHPQGGRIPATRRNSAGLSPFPASGPSIRSGGRGDDEGGPGDSPASVRRLRAEVEARERRRDVPGNRTDIVGTIDGRRIDPGTGVLLPEERSVDRLGRPFHWAPVRDASGRPEARSKVARVEPEPIMERRTGSTVGLSDWERWLEMCARLDGFPRHLSIHTGGMLITAAPLIDIAPLERATMPGRVVVQYDKRDVETIKLIKLDLLGLGMLAAIDETLRLIEHDCAVCLDLDRIPEEIPEVFAMLQAADTVGVFQVESRAQMQTLPKSRPSSLDDLVVEVAIIRPGPIQGNAVHPYLRRKQGLERVTYLHPSLEPILGETLGVILYQEQVMKIAIEVAGFTPAGSDAFRRAMGTWRSSREMEKLHVAFVDGCLARGLGAADAEELFRQCAAFASFGFAKSHAAAFARTAYESSFLKLFYPAQFVVGLINAQPMGFYPVEVLVNDAKRHGVTVLSVDINRSTYRTQTEWVGRPGWATAGPTGDDGSHDDDAGEPLPEGAPARPRPVRSESCFIPAAVARDRWAADSAMGWGVRLGLALVKGIGEEQAEHLDAELARGPYTSLADVVERTELGEEVIERLIRVGALDSFGQARRGLLWQLREVAGASRGRMDGRRLRAVDRVAKRAAGRPMDLRLPATDAPALPGLTESERLGDAYAVIGLDGGRQVVDLFRPALDRLGAVRNADLAAREAGLVRLGGLVVTRQHPMTARGTVFLALEDETGMVNVTLWPDTWATLRGIVRRHALLLVDGMLQREGNVVNVVAREVRPLVEAANAAGGPSGPEGVRQLGWAGMRRMG
ncbi:MAG TPA: PHP domain-containing protein [Candidatus Limnocylindrales bacterium]|nr:PHP domain-containing protein [Candidatus Limnocylindrales bacterium]